MVLLCVAAIVANESRELWSAAPVELRRAVVADWSKVDISKLAERREPLVIVGAPCSNWPAAEWTPEIIASRVALLGGVRQNDEPVFRYFSEGSPMAALDGAESAPSFRKVDLPTPQFFEALRSGGPPFHYFSADMESFPALRRDVPTEELGAFAVTASNLLINLWLGGDGVIAETHIDTSHNFYVQVSGKKRFLLLPPTAQGELGIYPFLHPSYRRARAALRNGTDFAPRLELLAGLGAVDVLLEPGQVLYLPPYWFHNVQAVGDSISFNIWTDSDEYLVAEKIFKAAVPFEEGWTERENAVGLATYADMLLGAFPAQRETMVRGLLARFEGLAGVVDPPEALPASYCERDPALAAEMQRGLDELEPLFAALPDGIRQIYMGNLLEVLAHYVFGVERVFPFFAQCLRG